MSSLLGYVRVYGIQIIEGEGADDILIETDLPCGVYPFAGRATLKMQAAQGTGKEYVARNFDGIPVEVISRIKGSRENVG